MLRTTDNRFNGYQGINSKKGVPLSLYILDKSAFDSLLHKMANFMSKKLDIWYLF